MFLPYQQDGYLSMKPQKSSRSFTRALALAFNEWLLILMLFINSIFSYVITRFADHSELQSPCLMRSQQQIRQGIGLLPLWVRVLCMIKKTLESWLFWISVCYCSTSTIGVLV
uniref:Uncharacterized protein n=1 Tax=Brassica oleracea var. oleracea TaxID=109376 RepID=A0A0D3BGC8_BRAOL